MVLRGAQEEIELAFNGLFNFMASSGSLEYTTGDKTVAKFWSSEVKMRQFFFNRHMLKFDSVKHADIYAEMQMTELANHKTRFQNFRDVISLADAFGIGSATAEKPDHDMKDAIILHAHTDKEAGQKIESDVA